MIPLFRKPFTSTPLKFPEIHMCVKIFYPTNWERLPYDNDLRNVGFQAKKIIEGNTGLFMIVTGHAFKKPFEREEIKKLTDRFELKDSTGSMGIFVCADEFYLGDTTGVWMLHKTESKGMIGYRATYVIYDWKYRFSFTYGTVSDDVDKALELYKENDPMFFDLVIKTKIK
jgi:hypothetical protein